MLQAFLENTRADADIDQDSRLFAFDIDGVAFTTAGKYGKFKNNPPLSRSTSAGNLNTDSSLRSE
jgi:hypothetical protein